MRLPVKPNVYFTQDVNDCYGNNIDLLFYYVKTCKDEVMIGKTDTERCVYSR